MTDELITVQSFALRYRVDASIIRSWIKRGAIPYELVGPRKMRLKPSAMLRFIQPTAIVGVFADYPLGDNYMRLPFKHQVIATLEVPTDTPITYGRISDEQRTSDQEGAVDRPPAEAGGDTIGTRRFAPLPKVPRGGRRTA